MRSTARRLLSLKALPAYLVAVLVVMNDTISAFSNIDFVLTARGNSRLVAVWNFLVSPTGNFVTIVLAGLWTTILVLWPEKPRPSLQIPAQATLTDPASKGVSMAESHVSSSYGAAQAQASQCQEKWLHDAAEEDRRNVDLAVQVLDARVNWDFNFDPPYVRFLITVFNGAVFPISLGPKIEGHLTYANWQCAKEPVMPIHTWKIENLPHSRHAAFELRQPLERDEAAMIEKDWNAQSSQSYFSLSNLIIKIEGGDDFKNVISKPLSFARFNGVDLQGRFR